MDREELAILAENEREWRQYMIRQLDDLSDKVDHIDKELSTFKVKIFTLAIILGGSSGVGADYLKNVFLGG